LINAGTRLQHATPENALAVPGRRTFFNYRDLGIPEASGGRMRAQVMMATGDFERTGWHYHICESQFVHVLKGSVDRAFEDGTERCVKEGESLYIPGGLKHNEIEMSPDLEDLEVCVPADMGTVPCDPPA
jgi:quercetin dioxygenase-like cupin family protein